MKTTTNDSNGRGGAKTPTPKEIAEYLLGEVLNYDTSLDTVQKVEVARFSAVIERATHATLQSLQEREGRYREALELALPFVQLYAETREPKAAYVAARVDAALSHPTPTPHNQPNKEGA